MYFDDFDRAVAVTNSTTGNEDLTPGADGGDHANLSLAGFGALANSLLTPQDTWQLNDGNGAAVANDTATTDGASQILNPDALTAPNAGKNPLTLSGGTSWTTDPSRGTVLTLDGTSGQAAAPPIQVSSGTTSYPVIDTASSYSVSAWVNMTNTTTYNTVIGESGTNADAFYLQYSKAYNAWTFIAPSSDSSSPTSWAHVSASTAPALNTWTHLVGTYSAATNTMSLYVNGSLAGTTTNNNAWDATGDLYAGSAGGSNYFPGSLSDIQFYNYALTPNQVTALYQQIQ